MRSPPAMAHPLANVFAAEHDRIWGLCYRMTGSSAEAEDLVQETFQRAIEHPPPDTTRPWRPWLTRVATRLSIDALRRRRTRGYTGPWLAEPVPTDDEDAVSRLSADVAETDAEVRYGALESATMAFLWALESLSPLQRAVLVLRDVMALSGPEVAEILQRSEASIRVTLHRARRATEHHDGRREKPGPQTDVATMQAMQRFMAAVAARDAEAMTACLCDDVVCVNDGGGVHHAALKPVHGADHVVRFLLGLAKRGAPPVGVTPCRVNGLPALLVELQPQRPRDAPRTLMRVDVDAEGKIWQMQMLLAPDKLARLRP